MKRREFVTQTSALAAGSLFLGLPEAESAKIKKQGIQLYTLRDLMKEDYLPVLTQLGKIGYKEIESFPSPKGHFWGKPVGEFAQHAADQGLKLISSHIPYGKPEGISPENLATLNFNFEPFVESFAKAGGQYLVCPNLDRSVRQTISGLALVAEDLNKAGEICKRYGVQFAYHNHDFEFLPVEDMVPYQYLLQKTDPDLVKMELDLYWAVKGYQDIQWLFDQFPGRFPLVHVKDMGPGPEKTTVEVGSGSIDFKKIFAGSKKAGIRHFLVEQDRCPGNPLESVRKSHQYLSRLRF